MLGLLKASARVAGSLTPQVTPMCKLVKTTSYIPAFPMDWFFRFFPRFSRDKVRFLYRWNQIAFVIGGGIVFYFHTPYEGANYHHLYHSWLFNWTVSELKKTDTYDENLRVKYHHFYPAPTEKKKKGDDDDDDDDE